jgi:hypothetical protein
MRSNFQLPEHMRKTAQRALSVLKTPAFRRLKPGVQLAGSLLSGYGLVAKGGSKYPRAKCVWQKRWSHRSAKKFR